MEYNGLIARLGLAGYNMIEPAIMIGWALGFPIRLIGRPGTGKTRVADLLSVAEHGPESYRRFDCPKENIVTIAGLPDIEAMKRGEFSFVHDVAQGQTSGFIWDKKHLTFNELTRISAEGANYLLEPLQEGTFFGQDLPIKRRFGDPEKIDYSILATENPEGQGVKRVDDALFDRFYMAVNVPDGQGVLGRDTRRSIAASNLRRYGKQDGIDEVLTSFAVQLRREFANILSDIGIVFPVEEYAITLWETFMDGQQRDPIYISNRRQANFTELVLAFAAYQRLLGSRINLVEAADMALDYGVIVPLKLGQAHQNAIKAAHSKAKMYLAKEEMDPKERFEAEIQTRLAISDRVDFLRTRRDDFLKLLRVDERENIIGQKLLGDPNTQPMDFLAIRNLLLELGGHEELFRKCEINIIGAISKAIYDIKSILERKQIWCFDELDVVEQFQQFSNQMAKGALTPTVIKLLLRPNTGTTEQLVFDLLAACKNV